MILLEQPSFQSLLLESRFGDTVLSRATGFIVSRPSGVPLLITNWHVVTGRNIQTREPLHHLAAIPDRLAIFHNKKNILGEWDPKIEPLYASENPLWLEHPIHRSNVDVIGLPLTDVSNVVLFPYDIHNPTGHDVAGLPSPMKWGASDFVNVIGFPFGLTGGGFGIWVQGAIATEPKIDYENLPRFLIDSRTREGQSGSPVVIYKRNGWITLEDGRAYMIHNPITQLIGVYSGRLTKESDLGTVWKTSILGDIARNGCLGTAL